YETANGFARDVERFLNDEPVTAGPPTLRYKIRKFVRRNRGRVIAASLILVTLVLGVVGTTLGLIREREARELTAQRPKQIELINNTVFDIFDEFDIRKVKEGPDPVEYVLGQKLVEAGKKLDAKAIHDPLVLANLQNRLGVTLESLGRASDAVEFLRSAREI